MALPIDINNRMEALYHASYLSAIKRLEYNVKLFKTYIKSQLRGEEFTLPPTPGPISERKHMVGERRLRLPEQERRQLVEWLEKIQKTYLVGW